MSADIVIIDYGIGNIKSICSALSHFNINISISNDEDESNSEDDGVDVEASINIKVMSRHWWSYVWTQLTPNGPI